MYIGGFIFFGVAVLCVAAYIVIVKRRKDYERDYDGDEFGPDA